MSTRAQAVLIGGAFTGVLSTLPFVSIANVCCTWLIGGGVVTAWLLQQGRSDPLPPGEGAAAGCLAGVTGAFVGLLLSLLVQLIVRPERPPLPDLLAGADVPPEMLRLIEAFHESALLTALAGFAAMLAAGLIFSTLGGLAGAALFGRGRRADSTPAPPPTA